MTSELNNISALCLARMVRDRQVSAREVTLEFIRRAKNDPYGAFITVTEKEAVSVADQVDVRLANGEYLPLAGVPVSVKDNICTDGVRTTCASRFLRDFVPSYSATAYLNLISAGAVPIGKTNMDEFAVGGEGDTSYFGASVNPLDKGRTTGGSSSGSAVSLASGSVLLSLGSDTGGSARLPAAFCGVYGMKPTYGSVSRFGLVGMAPSFEQICPMSRSLEDNELLLNVISGRDLRDMTSRDVTLRPFENGKILKVGVFIPDGCDSDVKVVLKLAAEKLSENGCYVENVTLPEADSAVRVYYTLSSAETYSNLARFDGMRYGHRSESGSVTDSRTEGFGKTLRERIAEGVYVLEHNGGETYRRALELRRNIRVGMDSLYERYDLLLTPVCHTAAPIAGNLGYSADLFMVYANLCGCPAFVIPFGRDVTGLPVGVQLMASHGGERLLYGAARLIEGRAQA